MLSSTVTNSMQNILSIQKNNILYKLVLCLMGSFGLALSSQISIPLQPVPITLQTAAVIFIGMTYGWRLGGCTVALYLLEGAVGFPVFADFSYGLPILLGSTGGYLLGFVPAAIAVGWITEKEWGKNILPLALAGMVGTMIVLISGWIMLTNFVGTQNAYLFGIKPFLFADIVKLLFVVWLASKFLCKK